MRIYPTVTNDVHPSLSRDSSENAVSSRVEACRKRLRLIRANHKVLETVDPVVDVSLASRSEADTEVARGTAVIEPRGERHDEAEIA